MAAVPKVLKNFNLNVQGQGFAGLCDSVRLPDLRIKVDEHRAGGMDAPIPIDLGMEKIEIGFTMAEHNPYIFNQFGLQNGNSVTANFYAALVDDTSAVPYVVKCTGMYTEQKLGNVQPGNKNPLDATIGCRYFLLSLGGTNLIEVDIENFTRVINGTDQLASTRECLNL